MATKLQVMSELAAQATEQLTQSVDNWKSFLDSAAWLYKYPFHEQVLIYAQRRDAKACAPIELWNSKFKRWVNRGAKGIALIDDSGQKPALRYVFDVSDTNTRYDIPFQLWQTKPIYEAQIIEELQNHFGETGTKDIALSAAVLGIATNAVSDNYRDYYAELLKVVDNSTLADMSEDEISSTFILQLMTSVGHTVLVRLGINPATIFHGNEYDSVMLFDSPDTIAQLGAATSDISEMILRQIERSVRAIERQKRDTLATTEKVLQNEDKESERSAEYGTGIQSERGLSDSRYRDGRTAGGDDRQIRQDAESVSQIPSERNVQRSAASGQADGASAGDRQDGAGTGRADNGADGASRGRNGAPESRRQQSVITSVDTASEALAVSIAEKARIDMPYMAQLTGKTEEQLADELTGVIFLNPKTKQYETADEYLSGDVRWKLQLLKEIDDPKYTANMAALEKAQPKDLSASEIDVRLGATWLPPKDIEQFIYELLSTAYYLRNRIKVHYSPITAAWNIEGKSADGSNVASGITYGTNRINAYKIIEETLNLKDVRIFDTVIDDNGNETRVMNKKETILAQQKQQLIKDAFRDWIWKDPKRRDRLTTLYNTRFNCIRPREYDGSHIRFVGMNPEITLRPHQVNAIARILYGGNTLLAHVVGAGKTFEMVAAAMESKRLGLCQKSMFVVPNHLTEQWAAEFLQLYPAANILVATKKDFETRNRKKFCSRIATGDYDAVIIGHSQFEKIPLSLERQRAVLQEQLDEIIDGIADAKRAHAERFTVKQLEKTKKQIKLKLDKLNDQSRKDDVVTFEELGVDRLFVDEAHFYKNLFLFTKMRNVAGLSQTEAQKSSDLFMKCRYLDELTGGRGMVFATGTPISNSMTELYTMQRYLQYDLLKKNDLTHFDAWASTFGETITSIELAPEGTGYRAKTRFARFYNLPELISMFKQAADIQTADILNLPVPTVSYHNVAMKPSAHQKEMVVSLAERAERVRNGMVDPTVDNMLKITNDGRKLALDQRLVNGMLPDNDEGKVNACVENIYRIWKGSREKRLTQLVFCDLSTPHNKVNFAAGKREGPLGG